MAGTPVIDRAPAAKRGADTALDPPIAKRSKATALPGWDSALIDHHAAAGEIG